MWIQFFLENAHFAINVLAALVFFALFWLYFDAWIERKPSRQVPEMVGILLLSLGFLATAVLTDSTIVGTQFINPVVHLALISGLKIAGYLLLFLGIVLDQIQPAPKTEGVQAAPLALSMSITTSPVSWPILAAAVGLVYWRRATIGLENHMKRIAASFYILSVSELLWLGRLFTNTNNVALARITAAFGPVWVAQHLVLLLAVIVLGQWLWKYLTKRLEPQLFMIFTMTILGIFLVTTTVFTGLLLKNLQDETLVRLETDVKVLSFALESKKTEELSDARVLATQTGMVEALASEDKSALAQTARDFLLSKKQSLLAIVNADGQVLARGEDQDQIGESLSEDSLVKRGLNGEAVTGVVVRDGIIGPEVSVRAVVPVFSGRDQVGAILTGVSIDNAFVDGVKVATGLEAAVYGQDTLAATTLVAADGQSRWIGTKESDPTVINRVLHDNKTFTGSQTVLNTPYFAAFVPVQDVDQVAVGMLFVGRPQSTVLAAASRSIELTFAATAILMMLAVLPAYLVSRFIARQLA